MLILERAAIPSHSRCDLCVNQFPECGIIYCLASFPHQAQAEAAARADASAFPQVKSVKPCLKQLQQCIQTISTLHDDEILPTNPADLFHWLPKEHMCVLVYLVRSSFLFYTWWLIHEELVQSCSVDSAAHTLLYVTLTVEFCHSICCFW